MGIGEAYEFEKTGRFDREPRVKSGSYPVRAKADPVSAGDASAAAELLSRFVREASRSEEELQSIRATLLVNYTNRATDGVVVPADHAVRSTLSLLLSVLEQYQAKASDGRKLRAEMRKILVSTDLATAKQVARAEIERHIESATGVTF